jgi:hypothetical protein
MVTPAAAPASATVSCPKCGAPVPTTSKFCNKCGASMTAVAAPAPAPAPPVAAAATAPATSPAPASSSAPAPAGATPIDLRQRVDDDRGIIKRLQLLVPGYRSYREGEDIRAADSLLRIQVADKIRNARATVENTRQALVQANQFASLTDLAPLIADLQRLEGQIRFAEQGYTGISPAVRINQGQLDRLYEYDFGFAQAGDQLAQTIASMPALASGPGASQVGGVIATARGQINQLDQAFKARIQAIEGIRVS